jgi:ceramide synthetase
MCTYIVRSLGDSAWSPIHVSLLWHRYDPSALPLGTRMYYLAQFGFYLQGLLFLLFTTDPKRVDHSVYLTHHVVTLSLIGGSYLLGWTRSGMAIFVLHDYSDIFLHLGKFGKFWRSEWLAGIAWAAFVSSYVLFRLIYYPQIVISVWTDSEIHLRMPPLEHLFFSVALTLLQVLHLVWFGFIVRSVARSIQSGQWTDARGEQDKDA